MPSERLALQPISLFVLGLPLVGFPETERVADDVERPLPHFDGDAADVLAQNADGDQVQRAEKQDQRHQRGIARHVDAEPQGPPDNRSEEHTSELQSLMRISY